ncbi:MAG: hypothetical protein WC216_00210 [Gallionella sp.]|jgi:hypothetical protein
MIRLLLITITRNESVNIIESVASEDEIVVVIGNHSVEARMNWRIGYLHAD